MSGSTRSESSTTSRAPTDGSGRSGTSNEGRNMVVHQIREASMAVRYPTLTRTNYIKWALLMRVNMQAQGV